MSTSRKEPDHSEIPRASSSTQSCGSEPDVSGDASEYPSPLRRPRKPPEGLQSKRRWDPPPQPINNVRRFLGDNPAEYVREYGAWAERVRVADEEGIRALLDHYQIAPDDEFAWKKLALFMARDYIPGFQMEWRPGRPREWPTLRYAHLYVSVIEKQLRNPSLSASAAAARNYRRYTTAKRMFAEPGSQFPPEFFERLKASDPAAVTQCRELLERMLEATRVAENRWLEVEPTG